MAITVGASDKSIHIDSVVCLRLLRLGNGMNNPRAQMAITLELRLVEELVGRAFMRKVGMAGMVSKNVWEARCR